MVEGSAAKAAAMRAAVETAAESQVGEETEAVARLRK